MPAPAALLIPHAASDAPACRAALGTLQLPALAALLARLAPGPVQRLPDAALDTPAERALAEALALPGGDGRWPWAARAARQAGLAPGDRAWALLTPCHLEVGMSAVGLTDPAALQLAPDEAEALLATMAPYLAEDGIVCERWLGHAWLAHGEPWRGLATAGPERVLGEDDLHPWLPGSPLLRRLQNEMQMLLYTHPVNAAREAARRTPVNALWISGCGTWPAAPQAAAAEPQVAVQLRDGALRGDAAAWAQAWTQVDREHCAPLLARLQAGEPVALTLCGRRAWQRLDGRPRPAWTRLLGGWRTATSPAAVLEAL
ncbi:hypothetical protein [Pseudorhodoferax sp.]|uniref:hypothetical protein n=1 Tax=Pseudorhodoferax sp. TaxID=1993553 RepID=UPI0039E6A155